MVCLCFLAMWKMLAVKTSVVCPLKPRMPRTLQILRKLRNRSLCLLRRLPHLHRLPRQLPLITQDQEKSIAAEEVKKKAAEEAKKKAAEEAAKKRDAEEQARKRAAEEAEKKRIAEEQAKKRAAEEAARKKAAEEAAKKKAAEEAARKKAEADRQAAAAANSRVTGAFGNSGNKGNSGNTTGNGAQGSPTGNSNTGATTGLGGVGTGYEGNRAVVVRQNPNYPDDIQEEGVVVVTIQIDADGNVSDPKILSSQTSSAYIKNSALAAARKWKFSKSSHSDTGKITFRFFHKKAN